MQSPKLGFAADSLERAVAGTVYVIEQQAQQGHTLPAAGVVVGESLHGIAPTRRTYQTGD